MKKFTKLLVCSFLTLCFGMSVSAQTSADSASVTFQVDMNSVTTAFTTPEVNGSFNNWCGDCWAMSDSDGDNVWDVSGKVKKDTAHEFKFSADGWGIQENLFSGSSCTVTNFGYTNRALNVSGDTTLGVVCWESCGPCGGAPSAYNVTFQVDMNGVSGFTTPEVNGTFNGWCGNCWAMSDADGDNVWDFTTLLAPGFYEYKFSADSWSIQESLDSNLSCVTTTIDTSLAIGYAANRSFNVVASDLTLDIVPWNGCASAVVPGCTDATANNYNASATSDDGSCMYDVTFTVDLGCESFTPGYVSATGPSDIWSCGTYALTDGDANGVWEGTFSMPAGTFEYIYCSDGWAQNETAGLIAATNAGGTCAPSTDYATYANRLITVGAITTVDTWGTCSACVISVPGCTDSTATNYNSLATIDDSSCTYTVLTITTTVCDGASSVMMTGPWWGWSLTSGPVAVDNGDSTFTFTFSPAPTGDMEYLLVVDGVQEDLVTSNTASADWSCTPVTDYWSYANRKWILGSGDVTNTYNTCGICVTSASGCMDSTATNYDPSATTDDGSCSYCTQATVNFSVDAGSVVTAAYDNVVINGSFASWNGWGVTLTDADGDGIYEGTLTVDAGSYEYVQALTGSGDGWSGWGVTGNAPAACEVAGTGNYGFTVTCGQVLTLPTVCFASCSACVISVPGCTDSTATNYNALATVDDGSCTYPTNCNAYPTGLNVYDVIDTRVNFAWDNMNTANCMVLKYYVRYREVGQTAWNTRAAGVGNGLCNFGLNTTSQMLLGLTASTTYEWKMKAFYCGGTSSNYSPVSTFTTADACPTLANLAVQTFTSNHTKANFTWDSTGAYLYARVALRVDTTGAAWQTVGGFGTFAPTMSQIKFGLVAGESYRAGARAYCDPNISAHRSWWTPFVFWTQPGSIIKVEGGTAINNLDIYPNPSRDIFNVSFTSEDVQDLDVRVINVVGEVVYTENLEQFVGEYTKSLDLATYTKGVYFLEITTNNGVVNKKLILQ
ncbi:T9SS type A sorting domain-containing protein [Flavobacteriales bacterium]|nr:T9SS type A sorting domain-containing protein [Flavobacteriales bacterium]